MIDITSQANLFLFILASSFSFLLSDQRQDLITIRDREQKIPAAEASLLKSSGLLKVLSPVKYSGGGQGRDVAYKVICEVAKGDGYVLPRRARTLAEFTRRSLGMVLGYPFAWVLDCQCGRHRRVERLCPREHR